MRNGGEHQKRFDGILAVVLVGHGRLRAFLSRLLDEWLGRFVLVGLVGHFVFDVRVALVIS